jgi:putative tricarboxylic transport membrane protein
MGRLLLKVLQDGRGFEVPIAAVNKPGGGGAVGLAYVNQRQGDGRVVMINAPTLLTNQITGRAPFGYADFTPLAVLGVEYETLAVRADSPLKSARDVIERLRKDPTSLSIAIGTAPGNAAHIAFAHAMKVAGVDVRKLKTVSFNSNGDGTMALLGGHVDVESAPASIVMPMLQTGKVRLLAISAPQRGRAELAQVPTWKELGVNSVNEVWRGLVGPKGLTREQIAFWDEVLGRAVKSDDWRRELERSQIENIYRNSAETAKFWKAEYEETKAILTEIGLAK